MDIVLFFLILLTGFGMGSIATIELTNLLDAHFEREEFIRRMALDYQKQFGGTLREAEDHIRSCLQH